MSGIIFFRTTHRSTVVDFYRRQLGFSVWLEQEAGCTILKRENLLLGFCDGDTTETDGIVTVVVESTDAVDDRYRTLKDHGATNLEPPSENEAFDIYQFFCTDPDGRTVEVQTFLHETPPVG